MDKAETKRVELHTHTKMSRYDGLVSAKDLIETAERWGWPAIAITDHGVIQAFPEAAKTAEGLGIKVIYGMEGYMTEEDYKQKRAHHISILAMNQEGLYNLYQLVTLSHIKYFHRQPRLPRNIIHEYRNGLLIGSACANGELIRAIAEGQSEDKLLEIASFYDYLEIQPIDQYSWHLRTMPISLERKDLMFINHKIVDLAKKLKKIFVATSDIHFINNEDLVCRRILKHSIGFKDADMEPSYHLRNTEEMLLEYSYLGEDEAYEAVVINPRKICDMTERLNPIPNNNLYCKVNEYKASSNSSEEINCYPIGNISTTAYNTSYFNVKRYFKTRHIKQEIEYMNQLAKTGTMVKNITMPSEAGIIVRRNIDINLITPLQYPANDINCGILITHFDGTAFSR